MIQIIEYIGSLVPLLCKRLNHARYDLLKETAEPPRPVPSDHLWTFQGDISEGIYGIKVTQTEIVSIDQYVDDNVLTCFFKIFGCVPEHADFILGSPLQVRLRMQRRGFYSFFLFYLSPHTLNSDQKDNYGFLSSVQIAVVDGMESIYMQNIEHLHWILDKTNRIPDNPGKTNFSRIRELYLDEYGKYLRFSNNLLNSLISL